MRRRAVPACEPLMPALARAANIPEVCSIDIPADLATGATYFMESANNPMSNADELNAAAITSVTWPVSDASMPNPRRVAPATSADLAKSEPDACAKFRVASVTFSISPVVNPSLANSNCNPDTSDAVNLVDDPKSNAFFSRRLNSSADAPDTAATCAMLCSKSAATLNDTPAMAPRGAVIPAVMEAPRRLVFLPKALNLRCACPNPLSSSRVSTPILAIKSAIFIRTKIPNFQRQFWRGVPLWPHPFQHPFFSLIVPTGTP